MGNSVASLALALWPVVAFWLFRVLPVQRAVICTILGGYLVLPPVQANFDLPLLPPMDKVLLPNLLAFAGAAWIARVGGPWLPRSIPVRFAMAVFVLSAIPTVLTNSDPIPMRYWDVPGLRLQDIVSASGTQAMLLLPFVLGWRLMHAESSQRDMLVALVVAGLAYSLPALAEIRLSPFLNTRIYGFFQHDFSQMFRYGGLRRIVFLPHPLWLAFVMMSAVVATATLARSTRSGRRRMVAILVYLLIVLVLCKTLSALLYTALALPLVLLASPRTRVRIALILALIAITYPVLRGAQLVPTDDILATIEAVDTERAASLRYRLDTEEELLDYASDRALLGWGGWGRNLVHDPETGEQTTVPDGRWIIAFGTYGWVGFLAEFGLLVAPILMLWRNTWASGAVSAPAATLALLLGLNLFDLIPNATLVPLTWLLAGTVLGYAERASARAPQFGPLPQRTVI